MTLPSSINSIVQLVLFGLGAYLLAFYLGVVVWTARDIASRSRDWLVRFLAVLLVAVFNLPGLILYFVLRPRETLVDAYGRSLEQEALLKDVEELATCPSCRRRVGQDFVLCPHCRTTLKNRCPDCERLLSQSWEVCPYCGKEQGPATIKAATSGAPKAPAARPDEATSPSS